MTVVSIRCPDCSTQALASPAALLAEVVADSPDAGAAAVVAWICVGCTALVAQPVGWAALVDLVAAGLVLVDADRNEPMPPYPESAVAGATWTPDDLLDLHEILESRDWLVQLLAADQPRAAQS